MTLHKLPAEDMKLDGGAMFGIVPRAAWARKYPVDENNLIAMTNRCLLVETGDTRLLIDTGIGPKIDQQSRERDQISGTDRLMDGLKAVGYAPGDITHVLNTHLHFDHCGGNTILDEKGKIVPAFPNARYLISRAQWELALKPNIREKASHDPRNFLPLKDSGQLELIEEEGELLPGIELRLFHGHTPGQIVPLIRYQNKTLAYVSDLIPTTAHILPAWNMAYDTRPLITIEEKTAFLDEALDKGYGLFFEHDYYTECCTLAMTEKGIRADKKFTLAQFLSENS